ncbi:kif21a protein, partial [Phycomyces blakesleeanus]
MTKDSQQTAAIQVALRIRPLTGRDRAQPRFANLAQDDVLKVHESTVQVVPHNKLFTFDYVFGPDSTQNEIFSALGDKLIQKFVDGYNVTILAYGQTSSGKTYTMGTAQHSGRYNAEEEGIVPRAMAQLFDILHQTDSAIIRPPKYTVKVSFVEIYNEELIDLLNSAPPGETPPVTIREDSKGHIYWTGVKEVVVHSTDDVLFYLEQGTQNRATGSTDMNEKSSRSHAIFSVSLRQEKWMPSQTSGLSQASLSRAASPTPSRSTGSRQRPPSSLNVRPSLNDLRQPEEGDWIITSSKFNFVDLAGSERLKRTAAEGDRRKEGININAGLLALGNVISALGDSSKRSTHIPYRDSKLTRLLQDSLGGSATTLMIACASPVEYNLSETLNTLQYANRARNIKNRIERNEVEEWMTTDNIELLRGMIGKLRQEVRVLKSGS